MHVTLPSPADVAQAVTVWRQEDGRLAQLMDRYGDAAPALRHFGLILWEDEQLLAASQILSGAVALAPDDARVWNDLSSVFDALGQRGEATACTEESLVRDPSQPGIWARLGSMRSGQGTKSIDAFARALSLDGTLIDAQVGLGLEYLRAKRFQEAADSLAKAVEGGKRDDPAVQACLGEALYSVGDFKGAAEASTVASLAFPDNETLLLKRARAQFAVDVIGGSVEVAVKSFEAHGLPVKQVEKALHDGFHLLSAFQQRDAAIRLGTFRLEQKPNDTIQAYLLATLKQEPIERAPDSYIVNFFDKFADDFDQQLVDVLDYRVPGQLVALLDDIAEGGSSVLDLGCGTGLTGPLLARPGRVLTGVDLSPRMLDKARRLGCYEDLIEAEVVTFLANNSRRYDHVIAADLLIYFGELRPIFQGAARALEPGGCWAFSIETTEEADVVHLTSGRFAHRLTYIEREAERVGFTVRAIDHTTIRLDVNKPALGALIVLSKASKA